jgi:hypothetical protein
MSRVLSTATHPPFHRREMMESLLKARGAGSVAPVEILREK